MLPLLGDFLRVAEETSLRLDPKYLLRVWWKRLWCVQEFMLSPRVPKIMIGPHLVRWCDFLTASGNIINPLFISHSDAVDDWQAQSHKTSLLELLRITATTFACTDPRDRVFALLGITNDADQSIQADYTKTVEEIYSEVTMYLINIENNIDMLVDQRPSRSNSSLPTWVPDFMILRNATEAGTPDGFRASSEKPVTAILYREASVPCGCTGRCLKLRAIRFDTIVKRLALEAERNGANPNALYRHGPYHFYREVPLGCNSDRLSGPRITVPVDSIPITIMAGNGVPYPWSHLRRLTAWLEAVDYQSVFLDWLLATLAVDDSLPSRLQLDRFPQIGLLLLDYLFNGSRSLERAVMYHHQHFAQNNRTRKRAQRLVQRHRLPSKLAVLHDLQIALGVQLDVLDKISKTKTLANTISKLAKLSKFENAHMHRDCYELMSTFSELDTVQQVILDDWRVILFESAVETAEIDEGVEISTSGYERVFFKTEDQHLGVGPGDLREGDEIVVPFGSSRPWVLRSHGDHHIFVGDAFVPGIMTGQLEELWKRGNVDCTDYVLR